MIIWKGEGVRTLTVQTGQVTGYRQSTVFHVAAKLSTVLNPKERASL